MISRQNKLNYRRKCYSANYDGVNVTVNLDSKTWFLNLKKMIKDANMLVDFIQKNRVCKMKQIKCTGSEHDGYNLNKNRQTSYDYSTLDAEDTVQFRYHDYAGIDYKNIIETYKYNGDKKQSVRKKEKVVKYECMMWDKLDYGEIDAKEFQNMYGIDMKELKDMIRHEDNISDCLSQDDFEFHASSETDTSDDDSDTDEEEAITVQGMVTRAKLKRICYY